MTAPDAPTSTEAQPLGWAEISSQITEIESLYGARGKKKAQDHLEKSLAKIDDARSRKLELDCRNRELDAKVKEAAIDAAKEELRLAEKSHQDAHELRLQEEARHERALTHNTRVSWVLVVLSVVCAVTGIILAFLIREAAEAQKTPAPILAAAAAVFVAGVSGGSVIGVKTIGLLRLDKAESPTKVEAAKP